MKEWKILSKEGKNKKPKRKLAALGVAAAALLPGGTPHELPKVDSNFVCDVASHRAIDPQLKDENTLQGIIVNAYGLRPRDGYQIGYYMDLATSNIGKPIPQESKNEIVDVEVQNDVVGLEFHTNHHQLYRDATRPSPDSITILTKKSALPVENLPVVLYSRKMIVQEQNRDRFYPVHTRKQKIVDPYYSQDTDLTRNHGVEVVRFCDVPGKGRIPVNAGYLDLRVFPVVYTKAS